MTDRPGRVGVAKTAPLYAAHRAHPFVHVEVAGIEDSLGELKVDLVPDGLVGQYLNRSLDQYGLAGLYIDAANVTAVVTPKVDALFECMNRRGRRLTFALQRSVNVFGNKVLFGIFLSVPAEITVGFLEGELLGDLGGFRIDQVKLGFLAVGSRDEELPLAELVLLVGGLGA